MVSISEISLGLPIEWKGSKPWYQPTFSPEHGVLIVLMGALLTGASLAQTWTWQTSLACLAAFLGLQAEHPLTVQIKQRRSLKPRYLIWAGLYGSGAIAIVTWLTIQHHCLFWVCCGGAIALGANVLAVLHHQQKAANVEILMFTAICLSTMLAYGATAGSLDERALGLWALNAFFFSSAVFTIKLRKVKTSSLKGGLLHHGIAVLGIALLCGFGWLSLFTALTFAMALLKLAVIIWQRNWYCNCRFEYIARFETYFALSYIALACLTVLPARLPPPG
ncbi:MAG: YwiC-like family protein [Cyanobacteria bacterium P01_E01_bin.6]